MTFQTWWLYLGAVILISATPGPNVLYVTTRSIRFGFGAAMLGMTGCLLSLTVLLVASVAGVSAFMLAVPVAFEALKYAGAAYLIYLGIQTWRSPVDPPVIAAPSRETNDRTVDRWTLLRGGFLVGISNPKLLVFAAAFFPQFMTPNAPWAPQFGLLVATFLAVEAFFYMLYSLSGRRFATHLMQGAWLRRVNRASGAIFCGFGVALLRYKP
ncbi:Threonine/homoserine/homoserine lactone efflux protein [Enhydrobacter aerosaccus]|uniref:Threonine/homoserine/homoserine lactone efflux protein n=1 Tax=Enhydrobacter aerosaccus TaxID=225324 RepID=A0A1T4QTV6_9HYPH|nr:LysE family translocator [Enhydrobacter aerosaccus]SKA06891.1 Threonine/homoserine/homoserine lactone efflux protein [Enhydrobacter aerosaccus]